MMTTTSQIAGTRMAWHALDGAALREALAVEAVEAGLDTASARDRLLQFGPNVLPAPEPVTLGAIVLHQFLSPLIYILLAAAAVAVALRDFVDAGFILLVVLMNAALGTYQEWRAERSAAALQQFLQIRSRVKRDGRDVSIAADELVPGDVVFLESGNRVPADVRLLRATNLTIDESFLTGESVAVEKKVGVLSEALAVAERSNMAYAGATTMTGRGVGVVVATGRTTEVGKIAATVSETATTKPPLVMRMERFARQISVVVLAACLLVAAVALAKGIAAVDVFFLTVALAVSAIPEGLPVAVTVALSIATGRMARRNVIVRRLAAVEGLGSCTYIASDKTGTLTVNEQTVREVLLPDGAAYHVTGEGYAGTGTVQPPSDDRLASLARAVVLCNEAVLVLEEAGWRHEGDAVDVALLAFAMKAGVQPADVRANVVVHGEMPFESERAYAAVSYQEGDAIHVAVKGALEALLPRCTTARTAAGDVPIDVARVEALAETLSSRGFRFIAVASATLGPAAAAQPLDESALDALTLLGVVGLIDPARPEARQAVAQCQGAGIRVAMVTGDHPQTALAIARDLGIASHASELVSGRQLSEAGAAGTPGFDALVTRGRVFARVSPMQKFEIVEALKRDGQFVAVTGDGVNDAPALRTANIAVAMGAGSDVTKDTASLIVTDDNFASIEAGVEEGRFAYDNIRKVTYLLISTGAAEVLLILLALTAGLPIPLLPVQLLWLNLVTNGIQDIALAFEGGERDAMQRPPRAPSEGIFNRQMILQVLVSGVTMGSVAWLYWFVRLSQGAAEASARSELLLLFVLMQNLHVFNCRSERASVLKVPLARNRVLLYGVLAAQALHLLAMHLPFMQGLLRVEPIALVHWKLLLLCAVTIVVVMELFKWGRRRT